MYAERETTISEAVKNSYEQISRSFSEALERITQGRLGRLVAYSLIGVGVSTVTGGGLLVVNDLLNSSDDSQMAPEVVANQRYTEQPNYDVVIAAALAGAGALTFTAGAWVINKNLHPNG
jgi:hypothetical protein